jgi:hypothetical protein
MLHQNTPKPVADGILSPSNGLLPVLLLCLHW